MLISYCVPCHGRVEDLARSWPTAVAAANQSPPVELVLVDYENLRQLMPDMDLLVGGSYMSQPLIRDRGYFHMAHARNVSIRRATGDYVMIGSADFLLAPTLFAHLRELLAHPNAFWLQPEKLQGAIVVKREVLIATGGYDERFEFYGPEDKELAARLTRLLGPPQRYDHTLLSVITTPDALKTQGYRLPLTKREMHLRGLHVLGHNEKRHALSVNEGIAWGA